MVTSGSNSEDSQTWNCLGFKSSCQSWEWTGVENSSGPHLARTVFWEKLCWSHKHSENEASFVKPCKGKQIQRSPFHYDVSKLWRGHATPAGPSEGCRRARHPLQPSLVWFWFVFRALVVKHLPRRTWQRQVGWLRSAVNWKLLLLAFILCHLKGRQVADHWKGELWLNWRQS